MKIRVAAPGGPCAGNFIDVLRCSRLADRRPVDDQAHIARMLAASEARHHRASAVLGCTALVLAGCEINRVSATTGAKGLGPDRPTVMIISADATAWRSGVPMNATLTRVNENGTTAGGGCILYDHTDVSISSGEPGRRYFAFQAPAGVYAIARWGNMVCDGDGACRGDGLASGPWPKAFRVPRGKVVYVGDFVAQPGNSIALKRDIAGARAWAGDRSREPPRLAQESPGTPAAAPFLCTP